MIKKLFYSYRLPELWAEGESMSLLIKDMKMPENCYECLLFDRYDYCCNAFTYGIPARYRYGDQGRPEWCELVEVKTPHGRLIDANAVMETFADRLEKVSERYGIGSAVAGAVSGAMKLLDAQPAVIEPECEP